MKDNYYSSSSVWRSYTTRGQVKGNKEGESLSQRAGAPSETTSAPNAAVSPRPAAGSQDSKDGMHVSAGGADEKPLSMPEEMGKSKVASWLTSQGLKKVSHRRSSSSVADAEKQIRI